MERLGHLIEAEFYGKGADPEMLRKEVSLPVERRCIQLVQRRDQGLALASVLRERCVLLPLLLVLSFLHRELLWVDRHRPSVHHSP